MTYRHSDSAARAGARAKAVVPRPGRARLDPGDRDSKLDSARGDRRHWRCLCMPGRRRSAPRFRFPHRGGGLRLWRAIRRQGVGLYESHNRGASSTARGGRSSQTSAPVRSRRSTSVSTQFRASSTAEARIGVVGNSALRFDCGHPTWEMEKRSIRPSLELRASSEAGRDPARSRWRRRPPSTN